MPASAANTSSLQISPKQWSRGRNFQTPGAGLLDSHPYVLPKQHSSRSTVFLHPATLLAALVVTGYVNSSELNATDDDGSRPEKSFGWFLNRHDLAATYSAIVIASVWDALAIGSSVSKPSDDLASLDHAQPAHGEHGLDIEQAVAGDSLLQNIHAFHGTDDRSVLTARARSRRARRRSRRQRAGDCRPGGQPVWSPSRVISSG